MEYTFTKDDADMMINALALLPSIERQLKEANRLKEEELALLTRLVEMNESADGGNHA